MLISFVRAIILYLLIVIAMRVMGKRQVGELQPTELVVTIILSELAGVPMQNMGIPLVYGIIPIVVLVFLETLFSLLSLKSRKFRQFMQGKAQIVMSKGIVDTDMLKKIRYNLDDLIEQIRIQGYSSFNQIDYMILETNGKISILPKTTPPSCSHFVIREGKFDRDELFYLGKSEDDINKLLQSNGIKNIKEIFYATIDENDSIFYQKIGLEG